MNTSADHKKSDCRSCHAFEPSETLPGRIDHVAIPDRISCRYCHEGMEAGDGRVEEFRCYSCHLEPGEATANELHKVHIEERDVACFECHGEIRHQGGTGRILAQNCETCHREQHSPQELVYLGQGGRDVIDTPGAMSYFHVECSGCHRPDGERAAPTMPAGQPHQATAAEETCLSCHEVGYRDKLRMWRTTIDSVMTEASRARGAVEKALALAQPADESDPVRPRVLQLHEDATYNIDLVAADRSRGVHNFKYTLQLLRTASRKLQGALDLLGGGDYSEDVER
jgi:hypothetical protein